MVGYDVVITGDMVNKDKLNVIEQGRAESNLSPSLDIMGKNFISPSVSAQKIEQQVERVTQSITNQLFDHVKQQVAHLEAIVSKTTNLKDDGQCGNR